MTDPRTGLFSALVPSWPTTWDSTMLGLLKECPRKFYFQIILGYQPRGLNVHLQFGLLYHAALERYDHARASGSDHDSATLVMVKWALEASGTRDESGVFVPWVSDNEFKNRYTLLRSVVWYVEEYKDSPLSTVILHSGKPAVELSFNFSAFSVADEPVSLCGHMDKLVQDTTGTIYVADHKTTKNQLNAQFFGSFSPHNQFSLYSLAGKVILDQDPLHGVLVSGAQIAVGFTRFERRPIPRPPSVLAEWLAESKTWIASAREYALADHFPGNDKSCHNYGGCAFQKVCSTSPSHRKQWLATDFAKWEWNPLVARGDI